VCTRHVRRPCSFVQVRHYRQVSHNPRFIVHQLNQLAISLSGSKEYDKACKLLVKAVDICKTYTIPSAWSDQTSEVTPNNQGRVMDPKYLLMCLSSLATAQLEGGNKADARKTFTELVYVTRRAFTEEKTMIRQVVSLSKAARFYLEEGELEKASDIANEILRIDKIEVPYGAEKIRLSTGFAMYILGSIEYKQGNFEKALEWLNKSWEVYRNLLDSYDVRALEIAEAVAMTHFGLKNFERARLMIEAVGSGYVFHLKAAKPSENPPKNLYNEKLEKLEQIHKKILSNLPDVTGPNKNAPGFSRKYGFREHNK